MNKLLKYSFYLLVLLIAPWLLIYVGLYTANLALEVNPENIATSLYYLGKWDGLLIIGLIVSASLIMYWQDIFNWYVKNHVKTFWSEANIKKLAKQTHLIVASIAIAHIIYILLR